MHKYKISRGAAFEAFRVNDGIIRVMNKNEWVSNSCMTSWGCINYPWIQLEWDSLQSIRKVILYDRPVEDFHTAGGTLHFSDGSKTDDYRRDLLRKVSTVRAYELMKQNHMPACSDANVFNYAGKSWLSQYWVRRVKQQAYGAITPDKGYGGHDENLVQMGGMSALMSMGLFSLRGTTSSELSSDITSPVFDEIIIHLDPAYYAGNTFIIKTHNNSSHNCYIQKAVLNGKAQKQFWFKHSDFAAGGPLEIWLENEPNEKWGIEKLPR